MHSSALLTILSLVSLWAPLQAQQQTVLHRIVYSDSKCSYATRALYNGMNQIGSPKIQKNSFYYLGNSSCSYLDEGYSGTSYINATIINGTILKYFTPIRFVPPGVIPDQNPSKPFICDTYQREKDNHSLGWYWSLQESTETIDPGSCFASTGVDTAFYAFVLAPLDVEIRTPISEYDPRVSLGMAFGDGEGRLSVTGESWQTYTPLTARNDLTEEFVKSELARLSSALGGTGATPSPSTETEDTTGENNAVAIAAIVLASVSLAANIVLGVYVCVKGAPTTNYSQLKEDEIEPPVGPVGSSVNRLFRGTLRGGG